MKKLTLHLKWLNLLAICIILQLWSCQSKIEFKLASNMPITVSDSIVAIKSYKLRYNPKAYGYIDIILMNGHLYKAPRLTPDQVSSLLVLLNTTGLRFDEKNSEFVLP